MSSMEAIDFESVQDDEQADALPQAHQPLRIALLGYRSKPFCGGQGIYIQFLSTALCDYGHQVDVISGPPYPNLDPRVRLIKIPSLELFEQFNWIPRTSPKNLLDSTNRFEYVSKLTGGFPEPETFGRRVVQYFRDNGCQYDIVHDNQSLCYGLLELQNMGVPLVTTIHHPITRDRRIELKSATGPWARLLVRRWHNFLSMQQKVVNKLNHVVTVSEHSRKDISDDFNRSEQRIDLVYNGIDTKQFKPIKGIERKPFRLMAMASADVPLKGLEFLLGALAILQKDYPELDLLLVGQPKPGGPTEKLINKLGIADKIQFVSGISTEQLVQYYVEATIAVTASLYEGFGLPIGEAMACGVPVVSSDGGALPEVVGDAGLVVPCGDAQALATAIGRLLDNPLLRIKLGEKGRQRILETFSWTVAAGEMTHLYQRVLNPSKLEAANTKIAPIAEQAIESDEVALACKP
ncbi:MAG: glycosyltransferase family 4 protein [Pseudomonadales bacterium]|nr:glycosyltransferase family 4 protein [Pseudomonadales bacterium]